MPARTPAQDFVAVIGDFLLRRQSAIRRLQWGMVAGYTFFLIVPALLPLPGRGDFIWTSLSRFAQFLFWGIWWPFVVFGTALIGRFWCGILCPEGALSEFASERGAGRAIPSWMKWPGWPVAAFVSTTIYGQLTSIYQYPKPAALLLGGSTVAAMAIGARFGKSKRVWCRFLCPVSGVFAVVSKIAPLHFRVDSEAWRRPGAAALPGVNCAPLIPIKTMQGGSACHMCGRCSGHRGAIRLAWRKPGFDIVYGSGRMAGRWETCLIVPVLLGLVPAALHWTGSSGFVSIRQWLAEFCVDHRLFWPLSLRLPWWILTDYPSVNDVMTVVDGATLLAFLLVGTLASTAVFGVPMAISRLLLRGRKNTIHHLAQGLVPLAAASLFCGLLSLTISQLHSDGITIPQIDHLRGALVAGAGIWSIQLLFRITAIYSRSIIVRLAATIVTGIPIALFCGVWIVAFLP